MQSCLQQLLLHISVIPNIIVSPFLYSGAPFANSPKSFWNRCGVIQVNFWKVFFNGIRGKLCFVVRDGRVKMMGYMSRSNFVMKEVDEAPGVELVVGTIYGVKCSLNVVMIVICEMGDINISMLKPCGGVTMDMKWLET